MPAKKKPPVKKKPAPEAVAPNPGGDSGGGINGKKYSPVKPVKIGRPRTLPPEKSDAKAASNARYKARLAGEIPPVEAPAPIGYFRSETGTGTVAADGRKSDWNFSFADELVSGHEMLAEMTGIEKFRVKKSKADNLENCAMAVMRDKGVTLEPQNQNMLGLIIILAGIYLPILWIIVQSFRNKPGTEGAPARAAAPAPRPTQPTQSTPSPAQAPAPQATPKPPQPAGTVITEIAEFPEFDVQRIDGIAEMHGALMNYDDIDNTPMARG